MRSRWILCALISALMLSASILAYLHLIPAGWFRAPWDKAGHFLLYGALALSLAMALSPGRRRLAWMIPLGLAIADEATQSLSPIRSADLLDLAADAAGILLAVRLVPAALIQEEKSVRPSFLIPL